MSQEKLYLLFVQIVVTINTFLFAISIFAVKKGNVQLHRKLNTVAVVTTLVGVLGLVATLFMGFDYSTLTTKTRMWIHRSFAGPLLPFLLLTAYAGIKNNKKLHKKFVTLTVPFWVGTLITGWWFF